MNDKERAQQARWVYYIDNCLPNGRVHLLAGASGAGKTTWAFQAAQQWIAGEPVLGFPSHGSVTAPGSAPPSHRGKFFYVSADKGPDETEETLYRAGVPDGLFEWKAVPEVNAVKEDFYSVPGDTRILFIDCAERLTDQGRLSDFKAVQDLLLEARAIAYARKMAIWFCVGSPKVKEGEAYLYGRERAIGTTAWGRFSSTMFNMTMNDPSDTGDKSRTLYVFPRNYAPSTHHFTLDENGVLVEDATPETALFRAQLLGTLQPDRWYTRAELVAIGHASNVSESTTDRALRGLVGKKRLEKQYGQYRVPLGAFAATLLTNRILQ